MQLIIDLFPQIGTALGQTFLMMVFTLTIAALLGIPLRTYLYLIRPGSIMEKPKIYLVLDIIVNIFVRFLSLYYW